MSIIPLQSSWWGRENWLLCLICLPGVSWWLSGSASWCHRVVCGLWLWYFLIILTIFHASWALLVLQQQQNLGRRFGTSKMHLSPPPPRWLRLLSVLSRWFCCFLAFCLLLLPLWESVIVLCFVVRNFMSILVLQSSWWGRERWLLCLVCLPDVSWWLCGSSSRCYGFVCGLWLWYFLIILTYYFW